MAFDLLDPLLIATAAIVSGCLFWRYRWRLGKHKSSPSSNPAEEKHISNTNSTDKVVAPELPATDNTAGLKYPPPLGEHVEHDRRILCKYTWASYESLPPAIQETVEPAVLKDLLAMYGDISTDACSAFLKDEPNFRALLLRNWENGSFEALRSDQKFLSLKKPVVDDNDRMPSELSSKEPGHDIITAEPGPNHERGLLSSSRWIDSEVSETTSNQRLVPEEDAVELEIRDDDEESEHGEDEGLRNQDAPVNEMPGRSNAHLSISKSKLTAGHDINVAVTVWRIIDTSPDGHKIATWFFDVVDYRAMHNEVAKKRSKSTGGWFLRSKAYGEWCTSPQQRLMWCPGIPGVGKTVMASLIADHLRMLDDAKVFVGIIYFNYKLRRQQSKHAIFAAFCRQVFETCQNPKTKHVFTNLYDSHEKRKSQPTDAELRSALSSVFQHYHCYLILDALDEYTAQYSDKQVREVINDILSLGPNVKLLITTRILGEMKATFQELRAIREDIVGDNNDMRVYLAERVAILKSQLDFKVSDDFSGQIVKQVMEAAKGRFLVAELGMNLLTEQLNLGELEDALGKLPNEIDDTYVRVIALIRTYPEGRRELAMKAIMWVAYARRQLSLRELQHALATKHGRKETNKYVTPLSTITGLCAGLIVVDDGRWYQSDGDRIVRFVHFTTQEFFGKCQLEYFSDAHKEIFSTCIEYLTITGNHILPTGFTWASLRYYKPKYLPFYEYSALNWGYHASTHHESLQKEVREFLLRNDRALDLSWEYTPKKGWFSEEDDRIGNGGSGIFLALYHHQPNALPLLCGRVQRFPQTKEQRTPLHIAVIEGWTNAVKAMAQWSASGYNNNDNPTAHDIPPQSTLRRCGDDYTFLENVQDKHGRTPLSYALEKGEETIVKMLLEHRGIEVGSKDNNGRTSFSYAVQGGNESTIRLLLEHGGIEVDLKDNDGRTPFSYAAARGNESIIKLLLEHGCIEVDSKDKNGETPFWYAVRNGNESVTKALLEHGGVEVDSKGKNVETPFWYAVRNGNESITKLLLEHGGVEVDLKNSFGETPFWYAVRNGNKPITKLLLECGGIEVDLKNYFGETPFCYAVRNGNESIIKLLLEHGGVEVDSKDSNGSTPFTYAVQWGNKSTIRLLLEHGGVEVDSKDNDGRTPFSYATARGNESIIKLLLERGGVEVDSKDNSGRTPFSYAAERGNESIIKLLRMHGAVKMDSEESISAQ